MSVTDTNGYSTTVAYPSTSQVVVTDAAGRTLTFTFTGGKVSSVADSGSQPRTVSYGYSTAGDLTDVVDVAGGHSQFTYDTSHRVVSMRSPKFYGDTTTSPSPVVTNHYDAYGRVDWQTDELGRTTTLDYTTVPGSTIVTDPKGKATKYDYAYGILVGETRGYGTSDAAAWLYEYDPISTATTRTTDPNGHVWSATFDASGNTLSAQDPLLRATSTTYNSFNKPLTVTNAKNVTTTLTYDTAGNLLTRSTPWLEGPPSTHQVVTYHYDDLAHPGDVTSVTDPAGETWVYTYDTAGNLATAADPLGNTTLSCFDTVGRPTSQISPRGVATGVTCATAAPAAFTSYLTYNAFGDVLTATDPLGHVTTNTYDADRLRATTVDPTSETTSFVFDPAGQLTQTTRADSTTIRTDYWPDGTVKYQYDGANSRTDYVYDTQGRLRSRTDPLGRTTTLGYDAAGNTLTKQDPGGNCAAVPKTGCTTYSYDDANQQSGIDYSDAATPDVTAVAYDNNGRRTSMTDGTGTTTYTWDSLGRMTTSAAPGGTVGYGYDLRGAETSTTYPNSLGTVTRTYDDAGRLKTVTDWLSKTTTYNYDADGNLTSQVNPNATTATVTVDNAGVVSAIKHAPTATPLVPFASFTYGRDNENKLTSAASTGVPADNHTWGYTDIDQVATDTAKAFPYSYDTADNLTQLGDGTLQSFDAANQLTSTSAPITLVGTGGAATSSGTTAAVTLPAGVAANDQILLSATYQANRSVTTPTGYTLVGAWQTGTTATDTKQSVFRKTAAGGETAVTVTFSNSIAKTVNAAVYRGVDATAPIDASGSATSTTTTLVLPSVTTTVTGTQLVGLLSATQGGTTAATWTAPSGMTKRDERSVASIDGAVTDQRVAAAGATGTRAATYGSTGKLVGTTLALKPSTSAYSYDTRGNRSGRTGAAGARTYGYDQASRLTSHTNGATTTTYTYNADGHRTGRGGPSPTTFKWAVNGELPLLLVEGTSAYIYGLGTAPIAKIDSTTELNYHHDQLGSIRAVTNHLGVAVATYSYDAYGNPTGSTGSITNPFGYAGEYRDEESGFVYLRARNYDPSTGQFLSRDPLEDATREAYGYVGGDPVNNTDPSGLWCLIRTDSGGCQGAQAARMYLDDVGVYLGGASAVAYVTCPFTSGAGCAVGAGLNIAGTGAIAGHTAAQCVDGDAYCWRALANLAVAGVGVYFPTRFATWALEGFHSVGLLRGFNSLVNVVWDANAISELLLWLDTSERPAGGRSLPAAC